MARGKRTDYQTAAQALSLRDEGRTEREISGLTGLPPGTVHGILAGDYGWGKIAERPVLKEYRAKQNAALEQAARSLAAKAYIQAEKKLPQASFYQAVYGGSILVDKAQLLAGLPTEISASYTVHEIRGLDKLASLLSHSLLPDGELKDVTTTKPSDVPQD